AHVTLASNVRPLAANDRALHAHQRLCLQRRRHARAEEFNGAHQRRVRQRREVHLKRQSRDSAEYFVVASDLVDDLVRPADNQRTMRTRLRVEVSASDGPPATLATRFGEALKLA